MCLDKYTNSKQLCITKVQKVKKKKKSSQPRISGANFNDSVTVSFQSRELLTRHLENKGRQWEIPHRPSQLSQLLPSLRWNFTHIITNYRNNQPLGQADHLLPSDTTYPKLLGMY